MALGYILWLLLITDSRASVFQLAEMITIYTGKEWSSYASYGCYCGAGNSGTNVTVDCSDACCEAHDGGYGELVDSKCNPYWDEYRITTNPLGCADDVGTCARRLCEYDVALTRCLAQWSHTYKQVYVGSRYSYCLRSEKNIDKSQCDYDHGTTTEPNVDLSTLVSRANAASQFHSQSAVASSLNPVDKIGNEGTEGRLDSTPQPLLLNTDTITHSNTLQSNSLDGARGPVYADVGEVKSTKQSVSLVAHVVLYTATSRKEADDTIADSMHTDSGREQHQSPCSSLSEADDKIADSMHTDSGREQHQSPCSSLLSACRQFSLAELLAWITMVTVAYLIGSILFCYGGVIVGRRKEELHCETISSCCCCAGQAFRYKKLASGGDSAETL